MQEAIITYERDLCSQVFLNLKKTDCIDYKVLKETHQKLREASLNLFKEKAVG
jgi:hypothetical protein